MPAAPVTGATAAGAELRRGYPDREGEVEARLAPLKALLAGAFRPATAGAPPASLLPSGARLEGVRDAAIAGLGGGISALDGLAVAHANDRTPPPSFVDTAGALWLLFDIGAVAGPRSAAVTARRPGGLLLVVTRPHKGARARRAVADPAHRGRAGSARRQRPALIGIRARSAHPRAVARRGRLLEDERRPRPDVAAALQDQPLTAMGA